MHSFNMGILVQSHNYLLAIDRSPVRIRKGPLGFNVDSFFKILLSRLNWPVTSDLNLGPYDLDF